VHLEASTKPPIHNLIHEFLINMAFAMACPNFKKGLKMAFGPLGVKQRFERGEKYPSVVYKATSALLFRPPISSSVDPCTEHLGYCKRVSPMLMRSFLEQIVIHCGTIDRKHKYQKLP
jgi:hypothetical protein